MAKSILPIAAGLCVLAAPALAQEQSGAAAAADPKTEVPRFSGIPEVDLGSGFTFRPRGRIQYDAGHLSRPNGIGAAGLGSSDELRRARLGMEGDLPGGLDWVIEADFAEGVVEITDANIGYEAADGIDLKIGQQNNFQSLEELTSSRFTAFMERAAFTDAFNFGRRVGVSATFAKSGWIVQAGLFTDNIHDLDDASDGTSADARIVHSVETGRSRLHLGGSLHRRQDKDAPEAGISTRYRQRPFLHSTDVRFLATPALGVESETSFGLEAAWIRGPFHAAAEAHWLKPQVDDGSDPTFFGGYAEIGWFLTGEKRGYRNGRFDRTRVIRPVEGGGAGAFQVNLRFDHLDLVSSGIRGGRQNGWQASLIWIPTDHVRFLINYARLQYEDAAIAAADGRRDYRVDAIGARAQIDF